MANQNDSEIDNSGGDKTVKISMLLICEVLLLTPVMVIIVGLFLIPTVLYGLTAELQVRVNLPCMHAWRECTLYN